MSSFQPTPLRIAVFSITVVSSLILLGLSFFSPGVLAESSGLNVIHEFVRSRIFYLFLFGLVATAGIILLTRAKFERLCAAGEIDFATLKAKRKSVDALLFLLFIPAIFGLAGARVEDLPRLAALQNSMSLLLLLVLGLALALLCIAYVGFSKAPKPVEKCQLDESDDLVGDAWQNGDEPDEDANKI